MKETTTGRAIITVLGRDQVGIIARVSKVLYENNINILDLTQTILNEYFTMVMLVDIGQMPSGFAEIQQALYQLGSEIGLEVRMQRSETFDAMHRL